MTLEEKAKNFVDHCQAVVTSEGNLYSEAAVYSAYLAGAQEALASQWRSVADEWPKKDSICLCRLVLEPDDIPSFMTLRFDGVEEWEEPSTKEIYIIPSWTAEWESPMAYEVGDEVTHWMPIHELPETDSHADKT